MSDPSRAAPKPNRQKGAGQVQKKRIDSRIKFLIENSIEKHHRSLFVIVGKRGKSQIVNLHWLLTRAISTVQPTNQSTLNDNNITNTNTIETKAPVLWCFKTDLGFSPSHVKQTQKIKKDIRQGLRRPNYDDPFESFILGLS